MPVVAAFGGVDVARRVGVHPEESDPQQSAAGRLQLPGVETVGVQ